MRISDWSSDVALPILLSLRLGGSPARRGFGPQSVGLCQLFRQWRPGGERCPVGRFVGRLLAALLARPHREDRKSVVEGKSVSVRVDLGGRRTIKTKRKDRARYQT